MRFPMPGQGTGRFPFGLIGALALIVVCERGIARSDLALVGLDALEWSAARRDARQVAPRAGLLCFGDSQVKSGVLAPILAERTGAVVHDLAVVAGQAPSSYFLLRQALAAGARPRAVIVDFKPHLLANDAWSNIGRWPAILGARDLIDLAWTTRDPALFAALVMSRMVPSVRQRAGLRSYANHWLVGAQHKPALDALTLHRNLRRNGGSNVHAVESKSEHENDEDRKSGPDKIIETLKWASWSCHPANRPYLKRFLDLTAARGIPVFWLLAPQHPSVQHERDQRGAETAYLQLIRDFQASYPHLSVIDARHSHYPGTVFRDPLHLDRRGAEVLSADLAAAITERSRRPERWTALGDYRSIAPGSPIIEDEKQSRTAVLDILERKRR